VLASVLRLQLAIINGFDVKRESGFYYNAYVVASAAGRYAKKEVLLWLKAHYTAVWGEFVCGGAIRGRRLEVLKWLHDEQQCEWSDIAASMAAQANDMPMLKYIYRKHDSDTPTKHDDRESRGHFSVSAVQSNYVTLLRWCKKHRLLVDGYERGRPNMYIQSIMSNCTAVQP
jgi:hypothetical protein